MAVLIDTGVVPERERFDFWSEASSATYHPMECRKDYDRPFWGRASGHSLGPLAVFRIEADASSVHRTPRAIAISDPETLVLGICAHGRCHVAQAGRESVVERHDITSYDSSHPYAVHAMTPFEWIAFMIPMALLRPHVDRICARTGERIPGADGFGRLATPFLLGIADGLDEGRLQEDDVHVADAVLDLVRGLYADRDAAVAGSTRSRAELQLRIHAFIETNLGDPNLSPERIARANAISVRYLHKLFESEGATVCEWIRDRRLERCRRDLADPTLRGETILTIASRWGLTTAAHFSRVFRDAYGCSPREFRKAAGRRATGEVGDQPDRAGGGSRAVVSVSHSGSRLNATMREHRHPPASGQAD
jgi:AraC-like DNA-binding protein